jgi:D-alanine-D-alanine ligase
MKIRICVLFGGKSVEHEISIISALQAVQNLDKEKYEIIPAYLTKDSRFYTGEALLDIENYKSYNDLLKISDEVVFVNEGNEKALLKLRKKKSFFGKDERIPIDMVLPVTHGTNVEDGALQGFLRTLGVPFAGCDVLSSAIGMDKNTTKHVLVANQIPVLAFVMIDTRKWQKDKAAYISRAEAEIGYPMIIKPSDLGSSIGIKTATDKRELEDAVAYAGQYSFSLIVEKKITNLTEINCAVLGDHEKQTLSACERPLSKDEILSFADKYLSEQASKGMSGLDRELPAKLDEKTEEKIRALAKAAFLAIGASGVSRIDFLIDNENNSVYVNEINTIPGSLSFYLFEPAGIKYNELLDELIRLAFKRERENAVIDYDYQTNILSIKKIKGSKK